MGQPIVVTNKVGAGSQIGLTETAGRNPTGILGVCQPSGAEHHRAGPERKALFDLNSLVFIINQVIDPGSSWAKGDSPYKTLKDLLEDARKRPGEIRVPTTGNPWDGPPGHPNAEQAGQGKVPDRPCRRGAHVFTAILGGQVDVAFGNIGDIGTKLKGPRSAS